MWSDDGMRELPVPERVGQNELIVCQSSVMHPTPVLVRLTQVTPSSLGKNRTTTLERQLVSGKD